MPFDPVACPERSRLSLTGEHPGKANNYLNVLKQLLAFACERDWRGDNPASGVSTLDIGEHEPWPADVLQRALAAASPMLRLAIVAGLCSGQRVSDVILMQHGWHDGRMMTLTNKKKFVAIPMHPLWTDELARHERKAVTLLYDCSGKPFSGTDRIQERIRRLMADIGGTGFSFHGLRKNACCYLLELGLSDTEAGAILGMTPDTVRHYGKRARPDDRRRRVRKGHSWENFPHHWGAEPQAKLKIPGFPLLVTPTGIEPVFQP